MRILVILFLTPLYSMAMGRIWKYEKTKDYKTKLYDSSLRKYDKSTQRLKLGFSRRKRDNMIIKARIFQASEWTDLEKDYLVFRAKNLSLKEFKSVYPQIIPYKLKRLMEIVKKD